MEDAGKAAQCSCGGVLVVPGSVTKYEVVEDDNEPKPRHFDWNEGVEPPGKEDGNAPEDVVPSDPGADGKEPELSDERCHDCGQLIPEGEICRMTIVIGSTQGFRHWGRVSLCMDCYRSRERAIKKREDRKNLLGSIGCLVGIAALAAIGLVILLDKLGVDSDILRLLLIGGIFAIPMVIIYFMEVEEIADWFE